MRESEAGHLKSKGLGLLPLIAILVLSLITVMVVTYVLVQCWNEYHAVSLFSADVRDKFDSYKIEAEDLQRLVSLLVAFSSLYALVLGVSSYVSAQGLLDRSRENAEQIERQRKQIEESFPFFKEMGKRMNEVKENLEKLMPDSDVRDDYYDRLDPYEKQKIEMVEQSAISWLYFLDFDDAAELASEIFRNLGKYYSAKYKRLSDALRQDIQESSVSQAAVVMCIDTKERERRLTILGERADFFLRSAIEKNRKNFLAYNDLAYLTQDIEGDGSAAAEELYRKSIRVESRQQRAYYDLAIVVSLQKKFREAESLSTKALEHTSWQTQPSSDRERDIIYNRACYRDRIAREAADDADQMKWQSMAESDLVKACAMKDLRRLKLVEVDCVPGGDLGMISSAKPDLIAHLRQILQG